MIRLKHRVLSIASNSFLISSAIAIIYSYINPDLMSVGADRASQYQLYNAINTPLNQLWPFITGLTTWTPISDVSQGIYFVELITHLPALVSRLFLEINDVFRLQRLLDIGAIIGGISLFADLTAQHLISTKSKKQKTVFKILVIGSFMFSPWTAYLLYKTSWYEPIFMLILIAAISALCMNKLILGSILLLASFVIHYQYAFFISFYFIACKLTGNFMPRKERARWSMPGIVSKKLTKESQQIMWANMGIMIFALHQLRKHISIKIMNLPIDKIGGSSAISRIGLDGNEHSGGLIGSLQFLGGYKWYYCFSIQKGDHESILSMGNRTISSIVNCELILATLVIFSVAAIAGIYMLYKEENNYLSLNNSWGISVLIAMFTGMLLVFQQSYTVHIIGYSYVWAFIFSIGFSVFIYHNFFRRNLPWQTMGIIVCLSCWNSLIQGSLIIGKIRETSSYW